MTTASKPAGVVRWQLAKGRHQQTTRCWGWVSQALRRKPGRENSCGHSLLRPRRQKAASFSSFAKVRYPRGPVVELSKQRGSVRCRLHGMEKPPSNLVQVAAIRWEAIKKRDRFFVGQPGVEPIERLHPSTHNIFVHVVIVRRHLTEPDDRLHRGAEGHRFTVSGKQGLGQARPGLWSPPTTLTI
jgi:hypothetical protein